MILWLLAGLVAAEANVPRIPPPTLTQDSELRAQHDGYLQYLAAHPDFAEAEKAWWALERDPAFRAADLAFDESLQQDIEAQTKFDRYYDRLHADATAKGHVDALSRMAFDPGDLLPIFSDVLRDPRAALEQLQGTVTGDIPDALAPMLDYLGEHPEVLNELAGSVQGLLNDPLSAARVTPWWTQAAQTAQGAGAAYAALTRYFAQRPEAFWDWHRRNLALAADAQARDWIRYWHRKVRRTPGLAGPYYAWLETHLELDTPHRQHASTTSQKVDAWPPKTAPPELAPIAVAIPGDLDAAPGIETGTRPNTPRPTRFQVQRPTRPTSRATGRIARPTPPTPPTRPSAR